MEVAVVGAGRIGGNIARQLARAGHTLTLSFARDTAALQALADELGARVATPAAAVAGAEVVVIAVPWGTLPDVLERAGALAGKVVVDTTNQFGPGPHPDAGQTAARFNAARMPGARYVKSFNTLTAAFQVEAAHREPPAVQWVCGDDQAAKELVAGLIRDAGYAPMDLGGTATCAVMEAPRRPGAVYGEEYRPADAQAVVDAVRAGVPIPPARVYGS